MLNLIDRLTQQRRPPAAVPHAIERAHAAIRDAERLWAAERPSDTERLAAALADTAVMAILGLHALGVDTAGHLRAACDRRDPAGRATRFTPTPEGAPLA